MLSTHKNSAETTEFKQCDLSLLSMDDCYVSNCKVKDCDIIDSFLGKSEGSDISILKSEIFNSSLFKSIISECDIFGSELKECTIRNCDLTETKLTDCKFVTGLTLRECIKLLGFGDENVDFTAMKMTLTIKIITLIIIFLYKKVWKNNSFESIKELSSLTEDDPKYQEIKKLCAKDLLDNTIEIEDFQEILEAFKSI